MDFRRPLDLTLNNSGSESNLRNAIALADWTGVEVVAGWRLSRQEPQEGKNVSLPDLLIRRARCLPLSPLFTLAPIFA